MLRLLISLACGAALLSVAARAQEEEFFDKPVVQGKRGLIVGLIYRSSPKIIDYRSSEAALYQVTGIHGRKVRLYVGSVAMAGVTGGQPIDITILPSQCAYSLDGGRTWVTFSSALTEDTMFPVDSPAGPTSVILVRIGARVTCSATQQRGAYSGGIRLNAAYITDDGQHDEEE